MRENAEYLREQRGECPPRRPGTRAPCTPTRPGALGRGPPPTQAPWNAGLTDPHLPRGPGAPAVLTLLLDLSEKEARIAKERELGIYKEHKVGRGLFLRDLRAPGHPPCAVLASHWQTPGQPPPPPCYLGKPAWGPAWPGLCTVGCGQIAAAQWPLQCWTAQVPHSPGRVRLPSRPRLFEPRSHVLSGTWQVHRTKTYRKRNVVFPLSPRSLASDGSRSRLARLGRPSRRCWSRRRSPARSTTACSGTSTARAGAAHTGRMPGLRRGLAPGSCLGGKRQPGGAGLIPWPAWGKGTVPGGLGVGWARGCGTFPTCVLGTSVCVQRGPRCPGQELSRVSALEGVLLHWGLLCLKRLVGRAHSPPQGSVLPVGPPPCSAHCLPVPHPPALSAEGEQTTDGASGVGWGKYELDHRALLMAAGGATPSLWSQVLAALQCPSPQAESPCHGPGWSVCPQPGSRLCSRGIAEGRALWGCTPTTPPPFLCRYRFLALTHLRSKDVLICISVL